MATRDLGHVHARRQALSHDRDLARVWPIPPSLGPRQDLDPPRTPGLGVIASVKHTVKSIPPKSRDRDRSGHAVEGGAAAPLTVELARSTKIRLV